MSVKPDPFSDAELTAFLDGEATEQLSRQIGAALQTNPELATRLQALTAPMQPIWTALDLDALDAPKIPHHIRPVATPHRSRVLFPLALAASFVLGAVLMNVLKPAPGWVDQVASYQALYVAATLDGAAQPPDITRATLTSAEASLGLHLTLAPEIPGMEFKRAQMLAVDGEPLIQLAYLGTNGTPFAFCVTRVSGADRAVETTVSHELSAASWIRSGLGFVLIGGSDNSAVSDLAHTLSETI